MVRAVPLRVRTRLRARVQRLIQLDAGGLQARNSMTILELSQLAAFAAHGHAAAYGAAAATRLVTLPALSDEITGRKSIDAALTFALAGVTDQALFDKLYERAEVEVRRRSSRGRLEHGLAHMAERVAASGLRPPHSLFDAIAERLRGLESGVMTPTAEALATGTLTPHSPPAARWVWRQHQQYQYRPIPAPTGAKARDSSRAVDTPLLGQLFGDGGRRDLTLDIGCGYGLGPLGLALWQQQMEQQQKQEQHQDQPQPQPQPQPQQEPVAAGNVLGVDTNRSAVGYAAGLAARWGLHGRCVFVCDDAAAVLRSLRRGDYPGRLTRVVLSCPTPFARSVGGATFPRAPEERLDFVGSAAILEAAVAALEPGGTLLLTANVEDVAVTMLADAVALGLEPLTHGEACHRGTLEEGGASASLGPPAPDLSAPAALPRRRAAWHAAGGTRAEGAAWVSGAQHLLCARSETELACAYDRRATYRVALAKPSAPHLH